MQWWCQYGDLGAHPRSRGENFRSVMREARAAGSSPLTRGKLRERDVGSRRTGLIPAHAGKTRARSPRRSRSRAHPRSRGENSARQGPARTSWGSSPLTRGKRPLLQRPRAGDGLIPAHAGKTDDRLEGAAHPGAHPRSRGENWRMGALTVWLLGSSPLTRGKPPELLLGRAREGLIPAHAGKTPTSPAATRGSRAHPRSRGENAFVVAYNKSETGSSPLTRGKRCARGGRRPRDGLIPAHAGKTSTGQDIVLASRAHPRSRGENRARPTALLRRGGSSPLTRGKHVWHADSLTGGGLIPAHAGKTAIAIARCVRPWAHPRSRGENAGGPPTTRRQPGSSPLTRGKPDQSGNQIVIRRLIPAHAGKTAGSRRCGSPRRAHPRSRGENGAQCG
mgnify:CR=1 FL=1